LYSIYIENRTKELDMARLQLVTKQSTGNDQYLSVHRQADRDLGERLKDMATVVGGSEIAGQLILELVLAGRKEHPVVADYVKNAGALVGARETIRTWCEYREHENQKGMPSSGEANSTVPGRRARDRK
jgi:hypothetical protein